MNVVYERVRVLQWRQLTHMDLLLFSVKAKADSSNSYIKLHKLM